MPLVLHKKPEQTWLDAALDAAKPFGLEWEVKNMYASLLKAGLTEKDAAFESAYEWDILDYENEKKL